MHTSVVIPTLNESGGIEDTFAGLSNQTQPPDSVIVYDGGSDDGTPQLAEQYGDEYGIETVVEVEQGANIGRSVKKGIELAAEQHPDPIIVRTDADSVLSPRWLETATQYLSEPSHMEFGSVTRPKAFLSDEHLEKPRENLENLLYGAVFNRPDAPKGNASAFRYGDYKRLGGLNLCVNGKCNDEPRWYEDARIWVKLSSIGETVLSRDVCVYSEMPPTTVSSPKKWLGSAKEWYNANTGEWA